MPRNIFQFVKNSMEKLETTAKISGLPSTPPSPQESPVPDQKTQMQPKLGKSLFPLIDEIGDGRRNLANSPQNGTAYNSETLNAIWANSSPVNSATSGLGIGNRPWITEHKRPSPQSPKKGLSSLNIQDDVDEESDGDVGDVLDNLKNSKFKLSARTESASSYVDENGGDESPRAPIDEYRFGSSNINTKSSMIFKNKPSLHSVGSRITVENNDMTFITVIGLLVGIVCSKLLKYLDIYCLWTQRQVLKLRNSFLGRYSIWEFFDFEDGSSVTVRKKLLLLPLLGACTLLYFFLWIVQILIRFLLAKAPMSLISFIKKL